MIRFKRTSTNDTTGPRAHRRCWSAATAVALVGAAVWAAAAGCGRFTLTGPPGRDAEAPMPP
ncbi:MAG TPA: hypothetical protein VK986_11720, partial [Tepidisphaeraceae bacterium]|nr:hypothetical protein [Tepidisphaeraceae bacterium]